MLSQSFITWYPISIEISEKIPHEVDLLVMIDGDTMYMGELTSDGWRVYFAYGKSSVEPHRITHVAIPLAFNNKAQYAVNSEVQKKPDIDYEKIGAYIIAAGILASGVNYSDQEMAHKITRAMHEINRWQGR